MKIDWFTFVAQIVNFLILLALLKHFLFGPLRIIMDRRERTVSSRLDDARQKLEEAEEKNRIYQGKLDDFKAQKEEMMSTARQEVEQTKREMLHQAREEINAIEEKWEESLEAERETFFDELHRQTATNIIQLLDRLVKDLANSSLEEQAINKFLVKLKDMDKKEEKRALQSAMGSGKGELKIVSSFALSQKHQSRIKKTIKDVFSTDINCSFGVSRLLGFGIEIRAEGWKMGWNAKIYLEDLKKNVTDLFDSDNQTFHQVTASEG